MSTTTLETADVWRTLATILDPEFGLSIVDLGLVYSVDCADGNVQVTMTLTTPTCPSGAWIHEGVRAALQRLPGVADARVALVFEPSWTPEMLSPHARRELGWPGGNES